MRIFDPEVLVRNFAELGSATRTSALEAMPAPNGIILVTGPTGSGKTTTLYSTLKQLATPEVNVAPSRTRSRWSSRPSTRCRCSRHRPGLAEGVRALMRQDPDIIMVGEIRDLETAEMAIQAALTGHLVLSTLHTNDAPAAVTRMLDLGVPAYLLNATVLGIMAQRLVRILCPHCKRPTRRPRRRRSGITWSRPGRRPGQAASTGRGLHRMPHDRLHGADRAVRDPADVAGAEEGGQRRDGYRPDARQAIRGHEAPAPVRCLKVAAGITTLEEVVKVAPRPRTAKSPGAEAGRGD
jgi:general secretion pathway protein E